ncbi:succinate dehydrogenase [ubiquinone] cytochrome b small subunit, mitochondrial [Ischnura elegans]|uniref:succinate dehydrogenase [ubiquinone] cytochrome b small subunit, mitochondrial n=1 Tax=Ischnura elegans TaxID=197161 RepID=UPI001ED87657|nr:succinate dehydrogenase [ubiquinone] cytochrome b small subunit, mitochondrial [Ischnura elegans]
MALSCFLRTAHRGAFVFATQPCNYHFLRPVTVLNNLANQKPLLGPVISKPFSVSPKRLASEAGDYSKLWTVERAVAIGLLGLVPAAFVFPSPPMDYILALTMVMHSHWGLEAVIKDYMRPRVVGALLANMSMGLLYIVSIASLGSLCYFSYTDVGLVGLIKMLWKL